MDKEGGRRRCCDCGGWAAQVVEEEVVEGGDVGGDEGDGVEEGVEEGGDKGTANADLSKQEIS